MLIADMLSSVFSTVHVLSIDWQVGHDITTRVNPCALTCQLQLCTRRSSCLVAGSFLLLMEHMWCSTSSLMTPAWLPMTERLTRNCLLIHKMLLGYTLPSTLQTNWHHLPHLPTFHHDPRYVHWWMVTLSCLEQVTGWNAEPFLPLHHILSPDLWQNLLLWHSSAFKCRIKAIYFCNHVECTSISLQHKINSVSYSYGTVKLAPDSVLLTNYHWPFVFQLCQWITSYNALSLLFGW